MRGWYNTAERLQLLCKVVEGWLGVPFQLNGESKTGASCAGAQKGIHFETGALWEDFDLPRPRGRTGQQIALEHMSEFLIKRPEFFRVKEDPKPGDIVTGKTLVGEYHMGTYMGTWRGQERSFVNCAGRYGFSHSNLNDPTYEKRLVAVWRIKHEEERT